jgi:hypothetical protein
VDEVLANSDDDTSSTKEPMPPLPGKARGRVRAAPTASKRNLMEMKLARDTAARERETQEKLAQAVVNAETDDEEADAAADAAPVLEKTKRKWGRPKGSKNKKGTNEKGTTAKRPVFGDGDDFVSAKAWVNSSETAVKGTYQKAMDFWQSVSDRYTEIVKEEE